MSDYQSSFNLAAIDLGALARNFKRISEYSKSPVMAVVKGDAYGHGLIPCAHALLRAGCQELGVLDLEEALTLGRAGVKADIAILAGLWGPVQSLLAVEAGVSVFAYGEGQLEDLAQASEKLGKKARIWLKVDTGMGRLGFPWDKAEGVISKLASDKRFSLLGLATHLATSGDEGGSKQLERTLSLSEKAKRLCSSELRLSALASGGLLAHRDFPQNLGRAGILLYGYSPLEPEDRALDGLDEAKSLIRALEKPMAVKSRLIAAREAKPGETIGYDRVFSVEKPLVFGTVPIGYVQGFSRTRSCQGHALVQGREAGLLGRVCMNLTMYDLRGIPAKVGDEVVLLGGQGGAFIGADLFGSWQNTSAYEVLCHLGRLNPRAYFES
jgi:alanine racemase